VAQHWRDGHLRAVESSRPPGRPDMSTSDGVRRALRGQTSRHAAGVSQKAARCTRPSGWCQLADRGKGAQCAVAASSVVVLDPGGKGSCAFVVPGEGLAVGPLGGQGAVEAFDLAVLPRAVRLGELLSAAPLWTTDPVLGRARPCQRRAGHTTLSSSFRVPAATRPEREGIRRRSGVTDVKRDPTPVKVGGRLVAANRGRHVRPRSGRGRRRRGGSPGGKTRQQHEKLTLLDEILALRGARSMFALAEARRTPTYRCRWIDLHAPSTRH
jgi:hypothetical protein